MSLMLTFGGPAAPTGESPPATITPTHLYLFDSQHFVVVFPQDMTLVGVPNWTASGEGIFEAFQNYGNDSVDCVLNNATEWSSVVIPADGATPVGTVGGGKVTAGTYEAETPPALTNTDPPAIGGDPMEGEVLSCSTGAWSGYGYPYATYTYQWQTSPDGESFTNIVGATDADYTLQPGDVGNYIRCMVGAFVGGSPSTMALSNEVGPVVARPADFEIDFASGEPNSGSHEITLAGRYAVVVWGAGRNGASGQTGTGTGILGGPAGGGAGAAYGVGLFANGADISWDFDGANLTATDAANSRSVTGNQSVDGEGEYPGGTGSVDGTWIQSGTATGGPASPPSPGQGGGGGQGGSVYGIDGGPGGGGGSFNGDPGQSGVSPGGSGGGGGPNAAGGGSGSARLLVRFVSLG